MAFCAVLMGSMSTATSRRFSGTRMYFVNDVLGEETVAEIDAALEVGIVGGHIIGADAVV